MFIGLFFESLFMSDFLFFRLDNRIPDREVIARPVLSDRNGGTLNRFGFMEPEIKRRSGI